MGVNLWNPKLKALKVQFNDFDGHFLNPHCQILKPYSQTFNPHFSGKPTILNTQSDQK